MPLNPAYPKKAKEALALALPIIAGQLGQILMGFFDTIQIGGLGHEYIAGSGFANNLFWMTNLLGIGTLFAVSTLVSEAFGEKHPWKAIGIYRSSVKLAFVLTLLFLPLMLLILQYLPLFGQKEIINQFAVRYLRIVIGSTVFVFLFTACKQLLDGMGRTTVGMFITLGGLILNIVLNWLLIYGKFGFPRMELEGAALATLIARMMMSITFFIIIWTDKRLKTLRQQFFDSTEKDKNYIPSILRIGLPSGLQFFWEVAAFGFAQIMSGWLGILEEAAHQIAIGLAAISFMMLTGISASGNILTGYSFGARDREGIRISGNTVFMITLGLEIIFALVFISLYPVLPKLYTDNPELIALAGAMLIYAAMFQISDGMQSAAVGVLRGMQDVRIPAVIAFISYWMIMIPSCYFLAFKLNLGLAGIWIGFIIGLSVAAILLFSRFQVMVKRVKFAAV